MLCEVWYNIHTYTLFYFINKYYIVQTLLEKTKQELKLRNYSKKQLKVIFIMLRNIYFCRTRRTK